MARERFPKFSPTSPSTSLWYSKGMWKLQEAFCKSSAYVILRASVQLSLYSIILTLGLDRYVILLKAMWTLNWRDFHNPPIWFFIGILYSTKMWMLNQKNPSLWILLDCGIPYAMHMYVSGRPISGHIVLVETSTSSAGPPRQPSIAWRWEPTKEKSKLHQRCWWRRCFLPLKLGQETNDPKPMWNFESERFSYWGLNE